MLDSNHSKTLKHLKTNNSLVEIEGNPLNSGLFCQIYFWLKTASSKIKNYSRHSKIAERRDSLKLNLFKKINEKSKNTLKILKTFPVVTSTNFITCFIRDSCLLYTSPSPRDGLLSRMPSSA